MCGHVFISVGFIPRKGIAESCSKCVELSEELASRLSKVAMPFYIPTSNESSHYSTSLAVFGVVSVLYFHILIGVWWHLTVVQISNS